MKIFIGEPEALPVQGEESRSCFASFVPLVRSVRNL
jgi:hypothetical protein